MAATKKSMTTTSVVKDAELQETANAVTQAAPVLTEEATAQKTAPTRKTPGRKPSAKKESVKQESAKQETAKRKTAVKEATKKAAAKTTSTRKSAAGRKAAPNEELHIQYGGKAYSQEDLVNIAKDVWKYDLQQKASALQSIKLYVKPEENTVYYVMNDEFTGRFDI